MLLNGIVLCFDYIMHLNIFVSYTLDLITLLTFVLRRNVFQKGDQVYVLVSRRAVTKYHILDSFKKRQKFILSQFRRPGF